MLREAMNPASAVFGFLCFCLVSRTGDHHRHRPAALPSCTSASGLPALMLRCKHRAQLMAVWRLPLRAYRFSIAVATSITPRVHTGCLLARPQIAFSVTIIVIVRCGQTRC